MKKGLSNEGIKHMSNNPRTAFFLLSASLALTACDQQPGPSDTVDTTNQRLAPISQTEPHTWLVPEAKAPQADNPDFAIDDAVVVDELELPDGAHAQILELPEDAGLGIIWLGASPEIDGLPASEYSPLELSQAFGTATAPVEALVENHAGLAAAGLVPSEARDLLSVGTTTDPSKATSIVNTSLCPLSAPSYWFNAFWDYYKQTCPAGTLCGSKSNDNTGVASGNFYIVALPSNKTALQTCNGGAPLGTFSTDLVNAQVQYYAGSGNWHAFYTSPAYAAEDGIVFTCYGFAVNRFRMRIYNANASTDSLAAAIW